MSSIERPDQIKKEITAVDCSAYVFCNHKSCRPALAPQLKTRNYILAKAQENSDYSNGLTNNQKVKYDDSIKVRMSGYSGGGKTGTSEPINGSTDGYIASFLAISPVENTKIVLLVILDTPGEGVNHNGGQIAAPTAGKMLAEILPHMGIESGNKDNNTNSNISEKDLY